MRIVERARTIARIPRVVFHKHAPKKTWAESIPCSAGEERAVAVTAFLARRGLVARVLPVPGLEHRHLIRYGRVDARRVSIILPTRDRHRELEACLQSIFARSSYRNFEIVLIDNGSKTIEAHETLARWKERHPDTIRVLSYAGPFNYSAINNYGVTNSSGDYLLFVNNDTEVITRDWMEAMIEYAQLPAIGAVGVMLVYGDGTVQHAGVVVGIHGCAAHVFRNVGPNCEAANCRLQTVQNYSAVTAACLMCRRELVEKVGGFDAALAVSFNDVDLCLKLADSGYRNVCLPHVKLRHYESVSRGTEDDEAGRERARREGALIRTRWRQYVDDDPCYNPNLSRMSEDFSLRVRGLEPDWDCVFGSDRNE